MLRIVRLLFVYKFVSRLNKQGQKRKNETYYWSMYVYKEQGMQPYWSTNLQQRSLKQSNKCNNQTRTHDFIQDFKITRGLLFDSNFWYIHLNSGKGEVFKGQAVSVFRLLQPSHIKHKTHCQIVFTVYLISWVILFKIQINK